MQVCVKSIRACMHKTSNLSWNHKLPTAQECQHLSLLLLNSTLHLGSCGLSDGAPSLSLPAACTSGTGAPHWTEPHLSPWQSPSSPGSVLLDPWTADTEPPPPPHPSSSSLPWAPACGKNCEMRFICILISLAKRNRTSALHWIHNVNKYQLFCLNPLRKKRFTLSRWFSR